MRFFDLFGKKLTTEINPEKMIIVQNLVAEVAYKKLAIDSCVDLIANSILKTEFETYVKGKKERKSLYYLLNVKPNKNMNQKNFMKKLVYKLIYENECLIIQNGVNEFVIADDFVREEKGLDENTYSFVSINNCQLSKKFQEKDVLYLTYYEDNIKKCIDSLYSSYGKLLSAAMNIYKRSNAKRYVMKGDFFRPQNDEKQKAVDQMINSQMKPWLEADNAGAIYQLQKGYELEEPGGNGKSQDKTSKETRELIDHFYEIVSRAFHISQGLLKGETVELSGQVDALLNFISIPIIEIFVSEINCKLFTKQQFLERTYLRADTTRLKVVSLADMANALDKLFQIGGICIDDIIEMMGGEPFNEEWSQERYITKNYGNARELGKGGDEDESRITKINKTTATSN
ncbi:Portal protein, phage associated [Enterococcus mundtii 1A]|uniref:phage portal protein n=1 Tax=Enterococcus mundtii TaxID=53346 RepID=UPI00230405BC|nr:phage portal protein [Enterococcus mundtii]MDA9429135.1 Portal protein, phage associated [Enterococcus mundtii 1A]